MYEIKSVFEDDGREYFFAVEILLQEGKAVSTSVATGSSFLREEIESQVSWLESLRVRPENNSSLFPQVQNRELFPSLQIFPFPEVENAYLAVSFGKRQGGNGLGSNLTFLYRVNENTAVEWEPEYGPFTKLTTCEASHPDARKNYFFPYITGRGYWEQLIVEESGIADLIKEGEFKEVFESLKIFGEDNA